MDVIVPNATVDTGKKSSVLKKVTLHNYYVVPGLQNLCTRKVNQAHYFM